MASMRIEPIHAQPLPQANAIIAFAGILWRKTALMSNII